MRVWNASHRGSIHLFGHSHGNLPDHGKSMDVSADTNNFYPYSIDDIIKKFADPLNEDNFKVDNPLDMGYLL